MSDLNSNQLGGYKATLHNPNTSEEAKQGARDVLDSAGAGEERGAGMTQSSGNQQTNRKLGGYKATLTNPNTSEDAKARAQDVLEKEGVI